MGLRQVTIIGLGLIGGSLGLAFTQGKLVPEVIGVDTDQEALALGVEMQAIHHGTTNAAAVLPDSDLVVLATPVGAIPAVVTAIIPYLKPGCILTDVGSTKQDTVALMEESLPDTVFFVGGHPMAGAETSGIGGADRYLFENAVYLLTPTPRTSAAAVATVRSLVEAIGARVITLPPAEHDLIVAAVSHLPHVAAAALVHTVGELARDYPHLLTLAAGGFRDTTRIAGANPVMWRDICLHNKEMLLKMLGYFRRELDRLEQMVTRADGSRLKENFFNAGRIRANIPANMKGLLPGIYELVVTVPDRPGMIAEVAQILAQEQINICDIEILRVREGEGGTIRLGFKGELVVTQALALLKAYGIIARRH